MMSHSPPADSQSSIRLGCHLASPVAFSVIQAARKVRAHNGQPWAHVVIVHPPVDVPTTFVIAAPDRHELQDWQRGRPDRRRGRLWTFIKQVPAGLPLSLDARSNWDVPLTVRTHIARA